MVSQPERFDVEFCVTQSIVDAEGMDRIFTIETGVTLQAMTLTGKLTFRSLSIR